MKVSVEDFVRRHENDPLLKDDIGQLRLALSNIEPTFMSPGQKAARDVMPSGQEPMGNQPVHQ